MLILSPEMRWISWLLWTWWARCSLGDSAWEMTEDWKRFRAQKMNFIWDKSRRRLREDDIAQVKRIYTRLQGFDLSYMEAKDSLQYEFILKHLLLPKVRE